MSDARRIINLNGLWQLQPGYREKKPVSFEHTISVPGLIDLAKPSYIRNDFDYHWYRKFYTIPEGLWNQKVILKIGQACFGTDVWINGYYTGSDIACYTSQEYVINKYFRFGEENEIVVCVGSKSTLPETSAVGNDYEKQEYIPGVWGDVDLICHGNPGIKNIQVIPRISGESGIAEIRIEVENSSARDVSYEMNLSIFEKKSQKRVTDEERMQAMLPSHSIKVESVKMPIRDVKLWSPESPFLYEVKAAVSQNGIPTDNDRAIFGMREFHVKGGDFYLNGKKIYLRGGNIAFHRFLSDPERGKLPWDTNWIRRLLIDIPKKYNFNFFRNHLGQMYNRWYDIADEYGMLIQNEWQFWGVNGSKEQIKSEFTQWLKDNRNHPSIIIWDALNETRDEVIEREIIPEMKKLDPTRPWEPVDFLEDHPYIYSLGPVLNDRRFGFTRAMQEIENLETPSVLNEFVWWWLDAENNPTELTKKCLERWVGKEYTTDMLIEHQCFLAQELVEFFRRMKVDAIQPFVYLSNNNGPTAHWFYSPIKELQPKPILKQLKNAFEPFAVSSELWDRHFFRREVRRVRVFVFNDTQERKNGMLRYGVTDKNGVWNASQNIRVQINPVDTTIYELDIKFPDHTGTYYVKAELLYPQSRKLISYSTKIAHILPEVPAPGSNAQFNIVVLDSPSGEIGAFLDERKISYEHFQNARLNHGKTIIVAEGMAWHDSYTGRIDEISSYIRQGGTLVLIEPEYGLDGKHVLSLLNGVTLDIERRDDANEGGYDSYVFAEDENHPLWKGIEPEHLKMFNGGFGGEVVSRHNVVPAGEHTVLARCGVQLGVIAVAEIPVGKGRMILSRLQLRGRLVQNNQYNGLYDRRVDPVMQRYFLNLITMASKTV